MDKRSAPLFYAFDSKTKPGKLIAHCIRIETQEFDMDDPTIDEVGFSLLGLDRADPRIEMLIKMILLNFKRIPPQCDEDA